MNEFLNSTLFYIGENEVTLGRLLIVIGLLSLTVYVYRLFISKIFPNLTKDNIVSSKAIRSFRRSLLWLLLTVIVVLTLRSLALDYTIYQHNEYALTLSTILKVLIFFQVARVLDWIIANVFVHRYYVKREEEKDDSDYVNTSPEGITRRIIQSLFYTIIALYVLNAFNLNFKLFAFTKGDKLYEFTLSQIIITLLVIILARILVWVITQLVLYNVYRKNKIELGSQYAINKLVKYVVYVIAIITALQILHINMTLLLGGAAALLVGVGLGLQQTFNDITSGIVLLFERTVSIGDVLEFEGTVGTIKKIGLRSSLVETREKISLVVPNHLLVNNNVINWTHYNDKIRFNVSVGVAYGSDTALVKKILIEIADENPYALNYPKPFIRLEKFGDSSLDFNLYFYSKNYMVIEDIKSDIRLEIDRQFREHNISIPFPQRDVHVIKDQ
ncbi:MAG: mechanosensitive ion channel [Saprospiraceae bacterium]|nr:mechanosensitive ion channel [Saprospiraceae bacterium]